MSDVPDIFTIPRNRWSKRSNESELSRRTFDANAAPPGERWCVLGAAMLAWVLVGSLIWLVV